MPEALPFHMSDGERLLECYGWHLSALCLDWSRGSSHLGRSDGPGRPTALFWCDGGQTRADGQHCRGFQALDPGLNDDMEGWGRRQTEQVPGHTSPIVHLLASNSVDGECEHRRRMQARNYAHAPDERVFIRSCRGTIDWLSGPGGHLSM